MALIILDLFLMVGATLRVTRLITVDELGQWFVQEPAYRWAEYDPEAWSPITRRQRLVSGLDCPFCVGFWVGVVLLASLYLAGGPGHAADAWRIVAGAFTLNYITGHANARLDSGD